MIVQVPAFLEQGLLLQGIRSERAASPRSKTLCQAGVYGVSAARSRCCGCRYSAYDGAGEPKRWLPLVE